MSLLPVGISGEEAGYQIERSLRFNSADSAYLNRTPASAGSVTTWTFSAWVKRSNLDNSNALFGVSNNSDKIWFSSDQLSFYIGAGAAYTWWSAALFRDPSAWYHIVVVLDTTNATESSRVRAYINGVLATPNAGSTSYPTLNYAGCNFNTAVSTNIGRADNTNNYYFNGYMTEIHFIDGQALTPTSFGEFNPTTGVWQPKAYTGSYGTNGFYLKFADNSGTTSTTLGKDSSGNGNNWTPNNFSVTAGAGNDSLVDTPTPYGTDTGVGGEVRGNYATMNPLDKAGSGSTTFSNGNLTIAVGDNANPRGTFYVNSGKWYWEGTVTAGPSVATIGIAESGFYSGNLFDTASTAKGYIYINDGNKRSSLAGSATAYGNSYTTNDVIGVALDMDAGTVKFYKNGTVQNSGTAAYTGLTGNHAPYFQGYGGTATWDVNFGQRPFQYTAPSGFKALVTTNLPEPTIADGGEYFNTVLYTGTGSSLGVTGVGFQPDWVWIKERSGAADHGLYDAVRGVQNQLESNTTTAETTEATGLTAFGTDGFTVGALAQLNTSGDTYVAWNWKANGAGSTNTAGTITSTVSVNTTSGFSIVTYTGNGSNGATVGHGLGVKPAMVIVKNRDSAVSWGVWHQSLTAETYFVSLNGTGAQSGPDDVFTAFSSTTFTLGVDNWSNANTNKYVAYCFAPVAGYSAFGSYTGNGSSDGVFVYTGFRPAFVMWKRTDTTGSWAMVDAARGAYNVINPYLLAESSGAEDAANIILDFLSNGFKQRNTFGSSNASGGSYIYMAFAENPFQYSLAR